MASNVVKMTVGQLNQLVKEEVDKHLIKVKVRQLKDAGEYADTLENKIDYAKALKLEEARLVSRLKKVQEAHVRAVSEIKALRESAKK